MLTLIFKYTNTLLICKTSFEHLIIEIKWNILFISNVLYYLFYYFFSLLKLKPKLWTDINWIKVTKKLYPGANSKVINTMFRWWVHHTVPSKVLKNVKGA